MQILSFLQQMFHRIRIEYVLESGCTAPLHTTTPACNCQTFHNVKVWCSFNLLTLFLINAWIMITQSLQAMEDSSRNEKMHIHAYICTHYHNCIGIFGVDCFLIYHRNTFLFLFLFEILYIE